MSITFRIPVLFGVFCWHCFFGCGFGLPISRSCGVGRFGVVVVGGSWWRLSFLVIVAVVRGVTICSLIIWDNSLIVPVSTATLFCVAWVCANVVCVRFCIADMFACACCWLCVVASWILCIVVVNIWICVDTASCWTVDSSCWCRIAS